MMSDPYIIFVKLERRLGSGLGGSRKCLTWDLAREFSMRIRSVSRGPDPGGVRCSHLKYSLLTSSRGTLEASCRCAIKRV